MSGQWCSSLGAKWKNPTDQWSGPMVQLGNYCYSSIRVASIDETKYSHRKITMTLIQTICPNCIAFCIEGAFSPEAGASAPVFEKSATELKLIPKQKLASLYNKKYPTYANTQKFKKAQRELLNAYQKEQIEYIQGQVNKIRNFVEDSIANSK